jgi:septum site-determining protein MinC
MAYGQIVILKGKKDGIDIHLDEEAAFEKLTENLREKVAGAKKFFAGANTSVSFKGRAITEDEEKTLLDIITAETTLDVSFVEGDGFVLPAVHTQAAPVPVAPAHAQYTEYATAYYHCSLRSGQSIRYQGSVVIMGDVNPGSEIVAHGHVIVLGSLKGMVHAGAGGDERCYVSALALQPTQLRIAGVIIYIEQEVVSQKQQKKPSWAYIKEGKAYIAPLAD